MYNYLYKITNLINHKIYVGVHKTLDLNDGYMGSGKIIKAAIQKYGIENFRKDILEFFDTYEDALMAESIMVTPDFLLREDVYNLRRGGTGGFDYINKTGLDKIGREKGHLNRTDESYKLMREGGYKGQQALKDSGNRSVGHRRDPIKQKEYSDRSRSKESIDKRKETYKTIGHQQKDKNSQYGTCWITNGKNNKKIKKNESIPEDWKLGRTLICNPSTSAFTT